MTISATAGQIARARDILAGLTLRITAPSRQLLNADGSLNKARQRAMLATFETLGIRVTTDATLNALTERFAGSDTLRSAALIDALMGDAQLVMALRGGYGMSRLLSDIPYGTLSEIVRLNGRAPVMMGFSDITALSLALLAKCYLPSWQGPVAAEFDAPDGVMLEAWVSALTDDEYRVTWSALSDEATPFEETLFLEGTLWGGNLAMVASLIGTPYMPVIDGGLFFFEEVNESAYRIERMLLQMFDAGLLSHQKAIIVGSCRGADAATLNDSDYSLKTALRYVSRKTGLPVIAGLPFGHIRDKVAMPVGVHATLSVDHAIATIKTRAHPRVKLPQRELGAAHDQA